MDRFGVRVHHLSLDHDLGDEDVVGNGYQVLQWIEERVFTDPSYSPPEIMHVHSANAGARPKMVQAIESIVRRFEKK